MSRRQGVIKLRNNGEFYIANEGKRPIYIDGKSILTNQKQKLNNNSVVEVCLIMDSLGLLRDGSLLMGRGAGDFYFRVLFLPETREKWVSQNNWHCQKKLPPSYKL